MAPTRAGFVVVCLAAATVPLVFTPDADDVFTLPKLGLMWLLFIAGAWTEAVRRLRCPTRLKDRFRLAADLALLCFVLLSVAATLASTDREQSLFGEPLQHQGLLTLLLYVMFFALARTVVCSPRQLTVLLVIAGTSATAVALYALVQKAGYDPVWRGYLPDGRVFSTLGQPNALGAYLATALPLIAAVGLSATTKMPKVLAAAAGSIIAVALVFTLSRGGYLALACATAVFSLVSHKRAAARQAHRCVRATVAIVLVLVVGASVDQVREAFLLAKDRAASTAAGRRDASIQAHLDQWRVATSIAVANPLLGTGPETFPDHFPRHSRAVLPPDRVHWFDQYRVESPHNVVLGIAAGCGIPAAAAYLALLSSVLLTLIRSAASIAQRQVCLLLAGVAAALTAQGVAGSFMTADVTNSFLAWTLAGAALALASSQEGLTAAPS